jgi:hypothetical protein
VPSFLDLRHCGLGDAEHGDIVGHPDLHVGALAGLDRKHGAVDGLDRAADPDRRRLLRPCGCAEQRDKGKRSGKQA